jgi:hypothetical protein
LTGLLVSEFRKKFQKFFIASMDVADNVKRTAEIGPIIPQRDPFDRNSIDFLFGLQSEDMSKPFVFQVSDRPSEL